MTSQEISKLMSRKNLVKAYVYPYSGNRSEYLFEYSPSNIASFIMQYPDAKEIILTDMLDRKILNTMGYFIDRCSDKDLLPQILEHLIPMQLDEKKPEKFPVASAEEVETQIEQNERCYVTNNAAPVPRRTHPKHSRDENDCL